MGAAASISICFKALTETPDDEFIVFAPFFPEYTVFIEQGAGAKCVIVPPQPKDFQIDFAALEERLNVHTKAEVINSPNNPCGVVYSDETIAQLADLLARKSTQYGRPIYLISDEPYREIVYDGRPAPFIASAYPHTLVCYSYSKSLSLPGERIGYVLVPDVPGFGDLYAAVCGAGRAQRYVCAPSLFQRVTAKCLGQSGDIAAYRENRDLLYNALVQDGFTCIPPEGAFYLFMKSPEPDAKAFCERAKKYELLLVPSDSFGVEGYVRISYCVAKETIQNSLPAFHKLAKEYGL